MGYQTVKQFQDAEVKEYRLAFSFNKSEHPHACAEVEASQQCAAQWVENGKVLGSLE